MLLMYANQLDVTNEPKPCAFTNANANTTAQPNLTVHPIPSFSTHPTKSPHLPSSTMLPRPSLFRTALHRPSIGAATTKAPRLPRSLNPRHQPILLTSAALGFSLPFLAGHLGPTRLDSPFSTSSAPGYTHSRDARTPLTKDSRTLNPAAVKQISLGSLLGLGTGVLVSAFSRTLTLLLGVGIVVVQVG